MFTGELDKQILACHILATAGILLTNSPDGMSGVSLWTIWWQMFTPTPKILTTNVLHWVQWLANISLSDVWCCAGSSHWVSKRTFGENRAMGQKTED